MINHLRQIAADIDRLLADDEFPATVRPDYLRDAVRDYPVRGGKRLRPAMLIWSCGLLGGSESAALYPAAAVEVFHNWTLVHDDIIDQDDTRRGAPTSHVKLAAELGGRFSLAADDAERTGRDFAILAGDLQQGWANDLLLRSAEHGVPPEVTVALGRRFQKLANSDLISGEALDVEFSLRELTGLKSQEVRTMLGLKTGALLQFCTEAGAMIALNTADAEHPDVRKLSEFALAAGIAFQLRDDYLGIFGVYDSLGKALGNDLREGKATVMLLDTLRLASAADREKLLGYIGRETYSDADLDDVRRIMRDSGAAASNEAEAARLAEQARNILRSFPDNPYRQHLLDLVNFLIDRER
ncbi:polyprenyl synthetase family protein [Victivallis vadensis]|uniref:Farnesyl-diphosphate synthase /geranylgeranyl-diphosphate synthase n=1 Tax=Victivallis vadensis TaxID=172901 RepID=A0A2U1B8I6_9BACT|nr:polyprenyl synthetase family protein [Victivallis vadensis]PVY44976.1 farnesyl-diphosphate synthase /geranylgeranyl-diphosphate synthase [Victivallis vadensis]HJH03762.1 polyprenyl synthetase family protein [Victivallis vadensis]